MDRTFQKSSDGNVGSAVAQKPLVKGEVKVSTVPVQAKPYRGMSQFNASIANSHVGHLAAATLNKSCFSDKPQELSGRILTVPTEIDSVEGKPLQAAVTFLSDEIPVVAALQTTKSPNASILIKTDEPELSIWSGFRKALPLLTALRTRTIANRQSTSPVISAAFATKGVTIQQQSKEKFGVVLALTTLWLSFGKAIEKFWAKLALEPMTMGLVNGVLVPAKTEVVKYATKAHGEGYLVFQGFTVSYITESTIQELFTKVWNGLRNSLSALDSDDMTTATLNVTPYLNSLPSLTDKDGNPVLVIEAGLQEGDESPILMLTVMDSDNQVQAAYIGIDALLDGETKVSYIDDETAFDGQYLIEGDNGVCAIQSAAPTATIERNRSVITVTRRLHFSSVCARHARKTSGRRYAERFKS